MSWKQDYLSRAERIAAMPHTSKSFMEQWNRLEDDIQGKLALWQCADLFDFVADIPCQGSMIILEMMPYDLPQSDM